MNIGKEIFNYKQNSIGLKACQNGTIFNSKSRNRQFVVVNNALDSNKTTAKKSRKVKSKPKSQGTKPKKVNKIMSTTQVPQNQQTNYQDIPDLPVLDDLIKDLNNLMEQSGLDARIEQESTVQENQNTSNETTAKKSRKAKQNSKSRGANPKEVNKTMNTITTAENQQNNIQDLPNQPNLDEVFKTLDSKVIELQKSLETYAMDQIKLNEHKKRKQAQKPQNSEPKNQVLSEPVSHDLVDFNEFSRKTIGFLKLLMALKVNERKGWLYRGMTECESIADHSYRMAVMGLFVDPEKYDIAKLVKMSLVHDMAECIVGDITPHCGVPKEVKLQLEYEGMQKLLNTLGMDTDPAQEIQELWQEYEDRKTAESQLVKDFDRIDLILQAITYQEEDPKVDYQEFFDSVKNTWFTDIGRQWSEYIDKLRSLQLQQNIAKGQVFRSVVRHPHLYEQFSRAQVEGCRYYTSQVISLLFMVGNIKRAQKEKVKVHGFVLENKESPARHMYSMTTIAFLLDKQQTDKDQVIIQCLMKHLSSIFDSTEYSSEQDVQSSIDELFGQNDKLGEQVMRQYKLNQETKQQSKQQIQTGNQIVSQQNQNKQHDLVDLIDDFETSVWCELFVRKNQDSFELIMRSILDNNPRYKQLLDNLALRPI